LLDTLRILVFNLFFVTGHPQYVWYTTRVQAIVFVPAVMVGAHFWGISGVALAADLMLLVGSNRLVTYLRQIVDFSLIRLTLYPLLALMIAGFAGGGLEYIWNGVTLPVLVLGKLGVFVGIYLILLLLVEWHDIWSGVRWVRKQVQ